MQQPPQNPFYSTLFQTEQCEQLFQTTQRQNYERTDRLFAVLLPVQWAFAIFLALTVSPRTWTGAQSSTHVHVYAALWLGGLLTLPPVWLAWTRPGESWTRHALAAGQLLMSALLIHLTGGRIETHFHVFGSLAFLAFYRDWRVLVTATVVVATEHLIRGLWFPLSIFGVATASLWRVLEHAGYVIFEDVILLLACARGTQELRDLARQQVALAAANQLVEAEKASIQTKVEEAVGESARQTQNLSESVGIALSAMERFAAGDLTTQLPTDRTGEIARLFDGFNRAVVNIRQLLQQVSDVTTATAQASRAIKDSTETLAHGASEQSLQASEVAAAIAEMAQTARLSVQDTQTMARAAQNNGSYAREGKTVVTQAQHKIGQLARVVRDSAEAVGHLGASSARIGEIISVIEDIADQTNLLALNAAIEAARAGQHGLGFAVVADEVRKLAERTNQATQQISGMIQTIQVETKTAVADMQCGTREVEAGLALSHSTGEALNKIVDEASRITDLVSHFVASSEEQSVSTGQISQNILRISHVTSDAAQEVGQIARAATELNSLTEQLKSLTARFTINASTKPAAAHLPPVSTWTAVAEAAHSFVH